MNDKPDYLWDKSGGDADVERLERALGPLAYRGTVSALPTRKRRTARVAALVSTFAAAAMVLLWFALRPPHPPKVASAWSATPLSGRPRWEGRPLDKVLRIDEGGWIETDTESRVQLTAS